MKYFSTLLFLFPLFVFSQFSYTISGIIKDASGRQMSLANIILNTKNKYAVSDKNGRFIIRNIQKGTYEMKISAVGFQTDTRTIEVTKDLSLNIVLIEKFEGLEDVVIYGKTEAKKQTEKAITINSLDIKQLQNQAVGTEEVLKNTTGLVIRQNGGLGSPVNINLNGLTGKSVRTYYDGIPLDVYGNGIALNTIPVDALERVDVYKGVMPIDVGTDALGGGINLIPLQQSKEYFRTSYSVGSFNTHRITFNGLKKINEKMSLSTISYFNYSDNDYKMRNIPNVVETELADGTPVVVEEFIDAKRFHDQHISGFLEARLRIKNLKWADRLEFASSYYAKKDELQHGGFIRNTAVGEAEVATNAFTQGIDYRKTFLNDKLKARYYGVLTSSFDKIRDSTTNVYDWRGERLNIKNTGGAEIFGLATLLQRENLGTAHRLTLNYKVTDHIDFKVSDFYRYTRVKGKDPIGERISINNELIDLNTIPSSINQNIFGAGLNANLLEDKLNAIVFFKNYNYKASSVDVFQLSETTLLTREIKNNNNGYGFALKYKIHPSFFVRTSFEEAVRIPTEVEIFGDLGVILPNYELEPEESSNWNLGAHFEKRYENNTLFSLNINGFIRDQKNLIYLDQVSVDHVQFKNEGLVKGKGFELGTKIIPLKNLTLKGNYTYQSNEIATNSSSLGEAIGTGVQVPNNPLSFYNFGANYTIENFLKSENSLEFFWNYLFIDKFSINEVADLDTANPDFIIPKQKVHNAGLTYVLREKGLSFSFNLQNIFNAEVFDNFRIPRPGINYSFKINYSL